VIKLGNSQVMTTTDQPITTKQINRIMHNCGYNTDIKDELVQWVTDDVARTSLRSITAEQANRIIAAQEGSVEPKPDTSWSKFDKSNVKHRKILSLLIQAGWSKEHQKFGNVADLERFASFLKSDKSPVKKPLKKMTILETEKIITALEGIVKSRWK
jgi:hypothetical protein